MIEPQGRGYEDRGATGERLGGEEQQDNGYKERSHNHGDNKNGA